jgi:hypothetical protein
MAASRPNRQSLALLHDIFNTKAISMPSTRGSGKLGHLALTISAANYTADSGGIVVAPPVHPGDDPIHDRLATSSEITETNRRFVAHALAHERCCIAGAALKA